MPEMSREREVMSNLGALRTGLLTSDHRPRASTGFCSSPAAHPWKGMGAREETQRPQASKEMSLSPYSPSCAGSGGLKYGEQPCPQASGIGAYLVTTVCICCVPSYPFLSLPLPIPWLLLRLSLEVMTILCRCENIETSEGVPLFVTGVAQVITHLLPPLCLTFSLPALWGLARRSHWTPPPKSVPPSPLLPRLLLWKLCQNLPVGSLDAKPKLGVSQGRRHTPLCDRAELSGWGGFSPIYC